MMSHSPIPQSPRLRRSASHSPRISPNQHEIPLNRFLFSMKHHAPSPLPSTPPRPPDSFAAFSDEILLRIFSKLPESQLFANSLVSKRGLHLNGRLVRSLKVLDFGFVLSGRVFYRFPNLTDVDIVQACVKLQRNSGILVRHKVLSVYASTESEGFVSKEDLLPVNMIDNGIGLIAEGYRNLGRVVAIGVGESGLMSLARECVTLQELELHCCDDMMLRGLSGCRNLQIVKLVGSMEGFYDSVVSDIGLTLLAQGCGRLVKLELIGCEGSYDGIKAVGQCCQMLEELTVCDHRMDGGWLSGLSFCGNLKTLRLRSCKVIDPNPGPEEHLGSCPTLEELHLQRCQMRDKKAVKALFSVCEAVRDIVLQDCWGLENEVFGYVSICRRVKLLSLEGCSLLTVVGLDSVIHSLQELQMLRVESCNHIKDEDITPAMASIFSDLKEWKWCPDSKSLLSSSLEEIGIGKKGGRFFN